MLEFVSFDASQPDSDIWDQISVLRHEVYAGELGQYSSNQEGQLEDPGRYFIACKDGEQLAGYISLNPPCGSFRVSQYFDRAAMNDLFSMCKNGRSTTFEIRGLTVSKEFRGRGISSKLMLEALKSVLLGGGTDIIAMGHTDVLDMYRGIGMTVLEGHTARSGDTEYRLMHMDPHKAREEHSHLFEDDDACYHGGQSWDASGFDFDKRDSLVVADVLDSPFPPCPEAIAILQDQIERVCMESPPTQCEELIETIAEVRGVDARNVAVSSGSSSLMFSMMPRLLNVDSRVLILSPMYGEYAHILEQVIGCSITSLVLEQEAGFAIDEDELIRQGREHDAVILVNPNSPTGVHCWNLESVVKSILTPDSNCGLVWVDETYIEYVEGAQSLESLAANLEGLLVCKSMSKCYALSGLRVAYAVGTMMTEMRLYIPPWAVSLPGQLAAVAALRNPAYYQNQYEQIHERRENVACQLKGLGFTVYPGVANYLLTSLPKGCGHNSASIVEACRDQGIFIRDAQNMGVSLGEDMVRFAIRGDDDNQRIISCLRSIL